MSIARQQAVENAHSGIDFVPFQGEVDFPRRVASDQARLFHVQHVGEQSGHGVKAVADGRGAYAHAAGRGQGFPAVEAGALARQKSIGRVAGVGAEVNELVQFIDHVGLTENRACTMPVIMAPMVRPSGRTDLYM